MADTSPVFVRLPTAAAERLDRASFSAKLSKRELVTALVNRYLDPDDPQALADLGGRRVIVESGPAPLTVGRAEVHRLEEPPVLTAEQAAELLQVGAGAVVELAEQGELPGRRVGGEWRFSRAAVLAWLGGADG